MSMRAPDRLRARQRRNILVRYYGADSPQVAEADRELRYHTLADLIRSTVDKAPPLTPEQRADLAALLMSMDAG